MEGRLDILHVEDLIRSLGAKSLLFFFEITTVEEAETTGSARRIRRGASVAAKRDSAFGIPRTNEGCPPSSFLEVFLITFVYPSGLGSMFVLSLKPVNTLPYLLRSLSTSAVASSSGASSSSHGIKSVGVIGCGQMGTGIAYVAAKVRAGRNDSMILHAASRSDRQGWGARFG